MSRPGATRGATRRVLRGLGFAAGSLLGLGAVLALSAVLVLRSERSATWVARLVLERVQVYPAAHVLVGGLRVLPSGWIEVRDSRLVESDTVQVASLDRVRLHVEWDALRRGEVEVDSLRVDSPQVDLGLLLRGLRGRSAATPPARQPAARARARVRVGHVRVSDGRLALPLTLHGEPVVLVARALEMRASRVAVAPGAALQLDSLGAELALAGLPYPAVLRARGGLHGGRAILDSLRLDTPASHLVLCGAAPVLGGLDSLFANLEMDFAARPLDGVDLRPFVATVPAGAGLDASVHALLRGSELARASGSTAISIREATWGLHRVAGARFISNWTDGLVVARLDGEADGRRVTLDTTLRPFDRIVPYELQARANGSNLALRGEVVPREGPRWSITEGHLAHFDLSKFVPGAPASNLNGTLQATGRGLAPDSLSLDAQLSLAASQLAGVPLDSLGAHATLREGAAAVVAGTRVHGTKATLDAQAHPFATEFALDAATLRFQGFDLTRWSAGARPPTDLSGTLTLTVRGLAPRTRQAAARVELLPSRIGGQEVRDAAFQIDLRGERVSGEGALRFPTGGMTLQAEAQLFSSSLAYQVSRLEFTALDLGTLMEEPGLHTQLTGRLALEGEGTSPETLRAHASLDLEPGAAFGLTLESAHADAGYDAGAVRLVCDLQVPGGGGNIEASGMLRAPTPGYQARGTLHSSDLARLLRRRLPEGAAEIEFAAAGEGLALPTLHASATLSGRGHLGAARLDSLVAALHVAGDTLRLDSLAVRSNVVRVDAGGSLSLQRLLPPAGESLHLTAALADSAPLGTLLGERHRLALTSTRLQAMLRGSPTGAALSAALQAQRLAVDTLTAASVHVLASASMSDDRRILAGRATATLDSVGIPSFNLRHVSADADYDGESLRALAAGALDDSTSFRLAAHGPLKRQGVGVLDTLALQLGPDHWALMHPVQVQYGERFEVDDFQLLAGEQRVAVNGAFNRHGEQSLTAQVDSLRLDGLARLLGWPQIAGRLTGDVQLSGPAPAPRGAGHVALGAALCGRTGLEARDPFRPREQPAGSRRPAHESCR